MLYLRIQGAKTQTCHANSKILVYVALIWIFIHVGFQAHFKPIKFGRWFYRIFMILRLLFKFLNVFSISWFLYKISIEIFKIINKIEYAQRNKPEDCEYISEAEKKYILGHAQT